MAVDPRSGAGLSQLRSGLLIGLSTTLVIAASTASAGTRPRPIPPTAQASKSIEAVSPSNAYQISLAEHLRQKGAVFYGAWWCSHCFNQINMFGIEGARKLPYVECDKEEAGRKRCIAAKVKAFPTWDLGGERREGVQTLKQLSVWSGFKGGPPPKS